MSIEITRRCNMSCRHCMRGAAQNIDIKPEYIINILRYVKEIGYLNLTGGEPSMNIETIKFILLQLKRRKIPVREFQIITNGSKTSMSDDFIAICSKLYDYQDEDSNPAELDCMLEMSNDCYHDDTHRKTVYDKLSRYPFFSNRYRVNNPEGVPLIKQGRSQIGYEPIKNDISLYEDEVSDYLYLNAHGYLISAGDLSYRNQEKHHICHSMDFMHYLETTQSKSL
ncbi:radical SAM protein [Dysgonomonas sp. 25]|uniref:radical SAM protein n=1 Tax=Dysgonomonas sp. 25 TaxID=2302933 RepID=UPI001C870D26|nr:radical SAM protein [Dysgonomonas sp. 25]